MIPGVHARSFVHLTLASLALAACSGSPNPSSGSAITASSNASALYVAEPDEGSVAIVELGTGRVTGLQMAGEPTRVARANHHVFVTRRAEPPPAAPSPNGTTPT